MTPEQKQQAKQLIADWTNVSRTSTPAVWFLNGDCMAGFLQELVDAPEPEPVARVTGYYAGYLSIATVDGRVLPAGTALYAAPPAPSVPSVPDGWKHDCAGIMQNDVELWLDSCPHCGKPKTDSAPTQPEPPAELPTWENGDDPLVGGGLISRGVVDFATVGIWPTKPAPSVPVGPMENIALDEWLDKTEWVQKELNTFPISSLGMHRADVMRLEIDRLRKLLSAAPTPAEAQSDVARDARLQVESEFAALLPGVAYMDVPDGGSPTVQEQVKRMALDAARYRWLLKQAWFQQAADRFDFTDGGLQIRFEKCMGDFIDAAMSEKGDA